MNDLFEENFSVTLQRDKDTGAVYAQVWRDQDGLLHNPIGPAVIRYDQATGAVIQERWMRRGMLSRLEHDGPAVRHFDRESGICTAEYYFADDLAHRLRGPAVIIRDGKTGKILSQEHFKLNLQVKSELKNNPP